MRNSGIQAGIKSVLLIMNVGRTLKKSSEHVLAVGEVRLPKGGRGSAGNLSVELAGIRFRRTVIVVGS